MPLLILTIGVPSAGKTTWVKEYLKDHGATCVVSNDQIRKELTGSDDCDPAMNSRVYAEAHRRAAKFLSEKKDVIVDATNVDIREWLAYKQIANGESILAAKVFNTPPDKALQFQKGRLRQVPKEVIEAKWKMLEDNRKFLPYIFNYIY